MNRIARMITAVVLFIGLLGLEVAEALAQDAHRGRLTFCREANDGLYSILAEGLLESERFDEPHSAIEAADPGSALLFWLTVTMGDARTIGEIDFRSSSGSLQNVRMPSTFRHRASTSNPSPTRRATIRVLNGRGTWLRFCFWLHGQTAPVTLAHRTAWIREAGSERFAWSV
jgi:hypothetical protein